MASELKLPLVVFLDILDQYPFNSDLTCRFKLSPNYESEGRDTLAIFKLGWGNITEYVAMKCIPPVPKDRICSVTFSRHLLPKNTTDLYQICYINGLDLHGASTPFQFCVEDDPQEDTNAVSKRSFVSMDSLTNCQSMMEKDHEISKLKEENGILRESLKILLANKTENSRNYNKDLKEIRDLIEGLKTMLSVHDNDISMLKNKIREGGEEYKKLYVQKFRVERKYDKLKSKYFADKCPAQEDNVQPINDFNLDLGDLKSIPPFPSLSKH